MLPPQWLYEGPGAKFWMRSAVVSLAAFVVHAIAAENVLANYPGKTIEEVEVILNSDSHELSGLEAFTGLAQIVETLAFYCTLAGIAYRVYTHTK